MHDIILQAYINYLMHNCSVINCQIYYFIFCMHYVFNLIHLICCVKSSFLRIIIRTHRLLMSILYFVDCYHLQID